MRKIAFLFLILILIAFAGCKGQQEVTPDPPSIEKEPVIPVDESQPALPEVEPDQPLVASFFVMIDNQTKARPQKNLDKADIVYEMICEGNITRFMAGFYSRDPVAVGPIRSTRMYYVHIAEAYNNMLVHIGGNEDALAYLRQSDIQDVCDIKTAGGYFYRTADRKSPHNGYIKTERLEQFRNRRKFPAAPLYEFPKGDMSGGEYYDFLSIKYGTSKYLNTVAWEYNSRTGLYQRYLNNVAYYTEDGDAVTSANVIIIEVPYTGETVPINGYQTKMDINSEGNAVFYRDGLRFTGRWSKASPSDHFVFVLDDSTPYLLAEGNTWAQHVGKMSWLSDEKRDWR